MQLIELAALAIQMQLIELQYIHNKIIIAAVFIWIWSDDNSKCEKVFSFQQYFVYLLTMATVYVYQIHTRRFLIPLDLTKYMVWYTYLNMCILNTSLIITVGSLKILKIKSAPKGL